MNLLNKLTIKNLKLNKKRTIVTIIGIILSVALLTAVSSMYSSILQSLINFEKYEKGDFHVMYQDVNKDGYETIKNNRKVEDVFVTEDIGYAKLDNCKNEAKPYAFVKAFTKESLEHLSIKLVSGRLPENDNEIIIPTHLKTNGRIEYKVGDTITLDIGDRVYLDTKLNQGNPYIDEDENGNSEELIITNSKEYKIVGIMERPASNIEDYSAPGYTFAILKDDKDMDNVDVFVKYNKMGKKNYYTTTAEILGLDVELFEKIYKNEYSSIEEYNKDVEKLGEFKYEIIANEYLIMLESDPLGDGTMKGLGVVVIVVCIIIIVSSVFCIKNSFDISIVEKTKQYGMLRSIGATKKQIRSNVLYEAFILGLIGIPLGVLLGLLASFILCFTCTYMLKDFAIEGFEIAFVINYIALVFSILLGIVTIYLSAIKSAFKASKVSPIDSIRNSANIKIKKQYNAKLINKLFGIGGVISYKNIKRNKKKYRTTIISIIVSTTVFIALSYFTSLFYGVLHDEFKSSDYNIFYSYTIENDNDMEKINNSLSLDMVEDYSMSRILYYSIKDMKLNTDNKFKIIIEDLCDGIKVLSIGDYQYNKYIKSLKLDDSVKDKGILYDYFTFKDKKDQETLHVTNYNKGDKLTIIKYEYENDIETFDIEIGAVVEEYPYAMAYDEVDYPLLIVSDSMLKKMENDITHYNISVTVSDPDKYQDILEKEYFNDENVYISNINEQKVMMDKLLLLICIFLYGFIIVVTLIGITTIFNTITTNMELRKPEFAMLKSIGMTSKEFSRMIKLECMFICVKALIISIIFGSGLSYLIYYLLCKGSMIKFNLPILPIIGAVIGVILLIYVIMKFSIGKINKQNTIETIRNENI